MSYVKKMAVLCMTADAFRELLQLPADVEVVRVELPPEQRGGLNIYIEGAGWDTSEGDRIMSTFGTVTVQRDSEGNITRSTIDWAFPPAT